MSRPVFTPGPPKSGTSVSSIKELKSLVTERNKIEGAKSVGGGTIKLFMTGPDHYYMPDTPGLRTYLAGKNINI